MPTHLEEGFVVCCSLCDTYLVLIIGGVTPANWRGPLRKALDDRNFKLQLEWERKGWCLARCPTCIECITGLTFSDWMEQHGRNFDSLTPLSPCRPVSFADDEPPALYVNQQADPGAKPKWTLTSGIGPQGLELDQSRSGRVWKPSLRQAGITAPRYEPSAADRDVALHEKIFRLVESALSSLLAAEHEARGSQRWAAELARAAARNLAAGGQLAEEHDDEPSAELGELDEMMSLTASSASSSVRGTGCGVKRPRGRTQVEQPVARAARSVQDAALSAAVEAFVGRLHANRPVFAAEQWAVLQAEVEATAASGVGDALSRIHLSMRP